MGEATSQIEAHIETTRAELGSNLQELEQKVKSVTDWKHHFQKNPMTLLGVAFGGGILLANMLGGRKNSRRARGVYNSSVESQPHAAVDSSKDKAIELWDDIKGALIGVAAARFKDFVGEVVPGFSEQFRRTEKKINANQLLPDKASNT